MRNENYKGKLLISSPGIVGDLFDKSIINNKRGQATSKKQAVQGQTADPGG